MKQPYYTFSIKNKSTENLTLKENFFETVSKLKTIGLFIKSFVTDLGLYFIELRNEIGYYSWKSLYVFDERFYFFMIFLIFYKACKII